MRKTSLKKLKEYQWPVEQFNWPNIYVIRVLKEEERWGAHKLFEDIIGKKKIPKFDENNKFTDPRPLTNHSNKKYEENTARTIQVKLLKSSDKENILQVGRGKKKTIGTEEQR